MPCTQRECAALAFALTLPERLTQRQIEGPIRGLFHYGEIMKTIAKMREQRNTLAKDIRSLLDNNPGKEWKPEHQSQYDAKLEDIERLDAAIDREIKAA